MDRSVWKIKRNGEFGSEGHVAADGGEIGCLGQISGGKRAIYSFGEMVSFFVFG